MSNPYQSPLSEQFYNQARQSVEAARQEVINSVQAPALSLMIVSGISIGVFLLAIPFNLLTLGRESALWIGFRVLCNLLSLAGSGYCLYGAWQMKTLSNYQHAYYASIVAMIPCLGPCCVLGIPFGAWAMTVLMKDEVRQRFQT